MIRVSEIFGPTIQGEGALIGQPTVFVRTGGCDYRCSWCDTLHAVDSQYRHEWHPMSAADIFSKVQELSDYKPIMISLSGGNPALQDFKPLIDLGHAQGYRFGLETQGSAAQDWFADLDVLTLSPKPPSSGMNMNWEKLEACIKAAGSKTQIVLKVVVFDEADYNFAKEVAGRYPDLAFYIQPGNHKVEGQAEDEVLKQRLRWLAEKVTQDYWFNVTVLPQLHVMIWGNKRGV